jgi:DNA-binding response OmpR family regulator
MENRAPRRFQRRGPLTVHAMRLLLIEDDVVIARELQLRWRSRGWFVQYCAGLEAAGEAVAQGSGMDAFDLIVLDLGLPDGDGVSWLAGLRQRDRLTPVLVLTARDRVADRVRGLKSGADDYLVKPFAADELDARMEALQRRSQVSRGRELRFGRIKWMGDQGRALVDEQPLELLPREFEVLGLLIRCAPRLMSKRALIDALAERNLELGDGAAELYVSRLRRKLGGSGVTIRTMRGFGYVLVVDPEKGAR